MSQTAPPLFKLLLQLFAEWFACFCAGAPPEALCSFRIEHVNPTTPSPTPQLHIAELQLFTKTGTQLGPADLVLSQSSTLTAEKRAAACFDGSPDSYCAADESSDPYPSLTMQYKCDAELERVVVTNRVDCCQEHLAGFSMRFFDYAGVLYNEYNFTSPKQQYNITPGERRTVCDAVLGIDRFIRTCHTVIDRPGAPLLMLLLLVQFCPAYKRTVRCKYLSELLTIHPKPLAVLLHRFPAFSTGHCKLQQLCPHRAARQQHLLLHIEHSWALACLLVTWSNRRQCQHSHCCPKATGGPFTLGPDQGC